VESINKHMNRLRTFDQIMGHVNLFESSSVNKEGYPTLPEDAFTNNERPDDEDEVKRLNARCSRLIKKSRFAISKITPTIGIFLSKLNVVLTYDPGCPTMAVDSKKNIYINPKFSSKITEAENVGVFVHETLHIINETSFRQKTRIHKWWNIATDYVMNGYITRDGFKIPKGGCIPHTIDGKYDAEPRSMVYLQVGDTKHEWDITGKTAEWLYNQFMKVIPEDEKDKDKDKDGGEPYAPQVGDVIYNKATGEYGEVTSVSGGSVKAEPISKEEAKRRIIIKSKGQYS